jgi:hypothetical protein
MAILTTWAGFPGQGKGTANVLPPNVQPITVSPLVPWLSAISWRRLPWPAWKPATGILIESGYVPMICREVD